MKSPIIQLQNHKQLTNKTFKKALLTSAIAIGMSVSLTACNDDDDSNDTKSMTLTIAHINDHHSHLEPEGQQKFTIDGTKYQAERGGFARIKQLYDNLGSKYGHGNFLKLHAGDAITGTMYYSFYKGDADAALMNTVCFDAFALGNHEFDDGDAHLKTFIDKLNAGTCQTPVLAANVKPAVGTPLAANAVDDYIKPYVIKQTNEGMQVGIIGLDIAGKTTNSSRPLDSTKFLDETESAQKYINELKAQGIDHIVLLTHYTYAGDKKLAAALTDVDVIIGGDSHTLLGDFSSYGDSLGAGDYPTIITNKNGDKVCIGQAWEYTKALGLMQIKFNQQGVVESCGGSAIIPIAKQISKLVPSTDPKKKGKLVPMTLEANENQAILDKLITKANSNMLTADILLPVSENQTAINALAPYKDKIGENQAKVIAQSADTLCLERIPGVGKEKSRSKDVSGCENSGTLARGSDVAQVVAESFLTASLRADFALQNGGGVRKAIPAGNITNKTAYDLLPFSNTLVNFDITGQQVIDTLEDAIANHMDNGGSSGSHPYAAGLRWDLDMSKTKDSRISNVEVKNRKTGIWSAIDTNKTYVMVTNDYIGGGKDGYKTLGEISKNNPEKVEDTKLLYTQSFIDYAMKVQTINRPVRSDYSHKMVITADGTTLAE